MLAHFPEYVRIGRELADLHLRYEKPVSAEELGVIVEMRKEDYTVVDKIRLLFLCSEMFLIVNYNTTGICWHGSLCQSRFNCRIILVGQHIAHQLNITFNFDLTPYIEGDDTAAC